MYTAVAAPSSTQDDYDGGTASDNNHVKVFYQCNLFSPQTKKAIGGGRGRQQKTPATTTTPNEESRRACTEMLTAFIGISDKLRINSMARQEELQRRRKRFID